MSSVSSIGSTSAATAGGSTSTSNEQAIARLRKQEAALTKQLKELQSSDGDAETIAREAQVIQQQISAIELQIARLEAAASESASAGSSDASSSAASSSAAESDVQTRATSSRGIGWYLDREA